MRQSYPNFFNIRNRLQATPKFSPLFLQPCSNCKTVLKDSALCLICGEFLCLKAPCDQSRHDIGDELIHIQAPVPLQLTRVIYSCTRHARRCGAGTCVFLQIGTSSIIVVRGTRTCFWGKFSFILFSLVLAIPNFLQKSLLLVFALQVV